MSVFLPRRPENSRDFFSALTRTQGEHVKVCQDLSGNPTRNPLSIQTLLCFFLPSHPSTAFPCTSKSHSASDRLFSFPLTPLPLPPPQPTCFYRASTYFKSPTLTPNTTFPHSRHSVIPRPPFPLLHIYSLHSTAASSWRARQS